MNAPPRPDPDALLARVQADERRAARGRLKVFLGAAAGVGKTYAMLEAAHDRAAEGVDVVVGWVDTHGRAETEAKLAGLEALPPRAVDYRGRTLREFDLDAALARRPALVVLDELAHTNAPGSRHPKRWHDVEELLEAGIDVYTTVNVQHLESVNDIVAAVTGVTVRETVPDGVLETAADVELVDLPPDELLARLRAGKVYVPQQADQALRGFFRKGNLIALRELALRTLAERVDAQMRAYRSEHRIDATWAAGDRILVAVGPGPLAPKLVRGAKRTADSLRAPWAAVHVETPAVAGLPAAARAEIVEALRLAEQLGGEAVTLAGHDVAATLLAYARAHNATKIVLGKPAHPRWRDVLYGSLVADVVRGSGDIDVAVISGERADGGERRPLPAPSSRGAAYAQAALVVAAVTGVAQLVPPGTRESNLVMAYLAGVVLVAARLGRGPAIVASVLAVAAFDFFYVLPYLTFAVSDVQYLFTFVVMLGVAVLISTLTARLRQQAAAAQARERRAAALFELSRELAKTRGLSQLLAATARHVQAVFGGDVVLAVPDATGALAPRAASPPATGLAEDDRAVAQWAFDHGRPAGRDSDTLPGAPSVHVPLRGARGVAGVLSWRPPAGQTPLAPEPRHLLETFANQAALAVERAHLADEAEQARVRAETESLRAGLLASVSHDLRTPLTAIRGSAEALLAGDAALDAATRRDLAADIADEADRLGRLVGNLLDLTRLESGAVGLRPSPTPIEEPIGGALRRTERARGDRPLTVSLPDDLPPARIDPVLVEQALIHLLENAARHTPPGTPIEVRAAVDGGGLSVEVADRGPGLPPGDPERLFESFARGDGRGGGGLGSGLGLAICRAIARAHGGDVTAADRPGGGAVFRLALPRADAVAPPPALDVPPAAPAAPAPRPAAPESPPAPPGGPR